jgi:hypothetical protein
MTKIILKFIYQKIKNQAHLHSNMDRNEQTYGQMKRVGEEYGHR